jgi:DNA-binding protein HU-beta
MSRLPRHLLNATLDVIVETVSEGDDVLLVGFGWFGSKNRAEKIGRNPQTGEPLVIKAKTIPTFKAGEAFVGVLNKT